MEIKVNSDKKTEIKFELVGEGHAFAKLLMHELLESKEVDIAHYKVAHPLLSNPEFYVKVKKGKPRNVVNKVLKSLKNKLSKLK